MRYEATVEGRKFQIEVSDADEVFVDGVRRRPDFRSIDGMALYSLLVDNDSYEMLVEEEGGHFHVLVRGEGFDVQLREVAEVRVKPRTEAAEQRPTGPLELRSPIPGVVVDVPVQAGVQVEAGQVLVVVESMKMENELRAPVAGVVREVRVSPEEDVDQGQVLLVFEAKDL